MEQPRTPQCVIPANTLVAGERYRLGSDVAEVKPTSCRTWSGRAWPSPGRPRVDARCDALLVSFLAPDDDADPDAAPLRADNWRELATRSAARYSCAIDPFHFADRFCMRARA